MAVHGVDDRSEIEHVPLNHTQMRVLRQPFGIADKCGDRVSLRQRLRNNQLAGTPGGAEDDDLHLSPVFLSH